MKRRTRQFVGTVALILFVPAYALVAMAIAGGRVADTSVVVQTVFYAVAGLLWVVPAGFIIMWMQRPERPK